MPETHSEANSREGRVTAQDSSRGEGWGRGEGGGVSGTPACMSWLCHLSAVLTRDQLPNDLSLSFPMWRREDHSRRYFGRLT